MKLRLLRNLVSLLMCCGFVLASSPALAQSKGPNPEASQEVRNEAVVTKLKSTSGTVAVYAQGLCCPSCAIGVRKKVSGLAFVDQARLEKGIELDAKTQLVTIAVKPGAKIDNKVLRQAILDAGYEPVHLYTMAGDKLVTTSISTK